MINKRDEDLQGQVDEGDLNMIRLSAVNRSTICQKVEEEEERTLLKPNQFQIHRDREY